MDETAAAARRRHVDPERFRVAIPATLRPPPNLQPRLRTGHAGVDAALPGGGLPLRQVVEVVGPPASGKTTLCCAASAQAAGAGAVLYIETRGADIAAKLQSELADKGADAAVAARVLGNVVVADVHTMDELVLLLGELLERGGLGAGAAPLQLVVVDCFADLAVSRVHAHPRETGLVCAAARLLAQVAQQLGSCVLTTNTTVRGEGAEPHKAALKATAGPSAPSLRVVLLPSGAGGGFYAEAVESTDHKIPVRSGA